MAPGVFVLDPTMTGAVIIPANKIRGIEPHISWAELSTITF